MTKREVKHAKEAMVRFGNCMDMARLYPHMKKQIHKEAKKYWDKVIAMPREVVETAADELNEQEEKHRVSRI